jgi:hypothetical protein
VFQSCRKARAEHARDTHGIRTGYARDTHGGYARDTGHVSTVPVYCVPVQEAKTPEESVRTLRTEVRTDS